MLAHHRRFWFGYGIQLYFSFSELAAIPCLSWICYFGSTSSVSPFPRRSRLEFAILSPWCFCLLVTASGRVAFSSSCSISAFSPLGWGRCTGLNFRCLYSLRPFETVLWCAVNSFLKLDLSCWLPRSASHFHLHLSFFPRRRHFEIRCWKPLFFYLHSKTARFRGSDSYRHLVAAIALSLCRCPKFEFSARTTWAPCLLVLSFLSFLPIFPHSLKSSASLSSHGHMVWFDLSQNQLHRRSANSLKSCDYEKRSVPRISIVDLFSPFLVICIYCFIFRRLILFFIL